MPERAGLINICPPLLQLPGFSDAERCQVFTHADQPVAKGFVDMQHPTGGDGVSEEVVYQFLIAGGTFTDRPPFG